jgi:ATP-dependent exoDNAse (exonuclease V) beta subunit
MSKIKKNRFIAIVATLAIVTMFSKCTCSSDNRNHGSVSTDGNILRLKFDFDKDPVNIHDIGLISKVELLNLDCEEAIFGKIDKIIKHKNRIYLLDIFQTYSVFIYDTVGKFVNVIEDQGQ